MIKSRVLIVDDNKDMLMMIKESLKLEGYLTVTAENGKSALSSLDQNKIDIILLDVMLPDIDGRLLCKKIKTKYDIPIIMISAKDTTEDKITGLDSGADDYIVKPFSTLELESRIRARLRHLDDKKNLSSGSLKINFTNHTITRNENPIYLTQKQWDILEYLLKHNREACQRKDITDEIWGKESIYNWSRVLDVHIQHLREKIENDPKNPSYLKTVSGVGYKIIL